MNALTLKSREPAGNGMSGMLGLNPIICWRILSSSSSVLVFALDDVVAGVAAFGRAGESARTAAERPRMKSA